MLVRAMFALALSATACAADARGGSKVVSDAGAEGSGSSGSGSSSGSSSGSGSGGSDSGASGDGSVDGGYPPCDPSSPGTLLCANFDNVTVPYQGWTTLTQDGNGQGSSTRPPS